MVSYNFIGLIIEYQRLQSSFQLAYTTSWDFEQIKTNSHGVIKVSQFNCLVVLMANTVVTCPNAVAPIITVTLF